MQLEAERSPPVSLPCLLLTQWEQHVEIGRLHKDHFSFHYSVEGQNATGAASFLTGAPAGSSSGRQDARNNFKTFQRSWTRVLTPTLLNRASFRFNNFINSTRPLMAGPHASFPILAGGCSVR